MAEQFRTIDAIDPEHFYVAVEGAMLSLGADSTHMDGIIHHVRVKRIHCELEVSDGPLEVMAMSSGAAEKHTIGTNQELTLATARLHLLPHIEPVKAMAGEVVRRFIVVDGADIGRAFGESSGFTRIGEKRQDGPHRTQRPLRFPGPLRSAGGRRARVRHARGRLSGKMFINRQRIAEKTEIHLGDILRIGNTHSSARAWSGRGVSRDKGSGRKRRSRSRMRNQRRAAGVTGGSGW